MMPRTIESRRRNHHDCSVNKQSKKQCYGYVDRSEEYRLAFSVGCWLKFASLRNRGMQIQIMRHHRSSQNADCAEFRMKEGSRERGLQHPVWREKPECQS